jgi:hypothetical protein
MYQIPKYKTGNCSRCPKENVPVRKRGRELVCIRCCQIEDGAKQIERAKLKPPKEKSPIRKSNFKEADDTHASFFNLIQDIDKYFSVYIRLREADADGVNSCFTCDKKAHWKDLQCGHYIPRTHLLTRFDTRNCHPQCKTCNEYLSGNLTEYTKRLEAECRGITGALFEQSRSVYKPSVYELKELLSEWKERAKMAQMRLKKEGKK